MKKFTKLLISTSNENINILKHFSRIFDFGSEIIKSPKLLSTGLYIWRNIFDFFEEYGFNTSDNDEDSNLILNLLFILLSISSTSLSSENVEDRLQSLKLIEILHDFLIDVENLNESQTTIGMTLLQSLHQEFNRSVLSDTAELSQCCSVVCSFMEEPPDFINDQVLSTFFELSISFLTNANLPIEKRFIIHTIFESSVDLIVNNECYRSKINDLINISISMSIEICAQDRNDSNYEFPYRFFYSLSDAFNDSEANGNSIFELFMTFASNLAQNEALNQKLLGRQLSLFVVKTIVESLQEIVSIRINDIIRFIFQYGDVNDEYVLNSACQLIAELFEYATTSASKYLNEITAFLTKYATFSMSIQTLDIVFYRSDRPPTNIENIFKGLASMISASSTNDQIESLLSCITSLFSRHMSTEEHIFSSFLPLLNQLVSSPAHVDLRPSVLDFFGRIVHIAPLTIKSELTNIVSFAADSFSLTNFAADVSASFCLRAISRVLPATFSPFLSVVVPPLVALLQHADDLDESADLCVTFCDDRSVDEYLSDLAKAQREAMLTLASFVGSMPAEMRDYAQTPVLDFIVSDKGGLSRFVVHACEALGYAAEGYKMLGIPLYNVMQKAVPLLFDADAEKDNVFAVIMLCSEIVAEFGEVMSDEVVDLVVTSLVNILVSTPQGFLLSDSAASSFDPQLQAPFFFLFSQCIDMFGEKRFEKYFGKVSQILVACFNNNNKSLSLRCNAIMTAAHLCYLLRANQGCLAFAQIIQNASFQVMMSSQNNEANVLIAKAFKYLILANKDQLQQRINMLIQFAFDVIDKGEYFGLFCAILMAYNGIFDAKSCTQKINEFIEFLPPIPDSEDVVFFSQFVVFLLKNNIELEHLNLKLPSTAAALFASSEKHFKSIDQETRNVFASILSKLPPEALVSLNKADESKLVRISNHMKMIADA